MQEHVKSNVVTFEPKAQPRPIVRYRPALRAGQEVTVGCHRFKIQSVGKGCMTLRSLPDLPEADNAIHDAAAILADLSNRYRMTTVEEAAIAVCVKAVNDIRKLEETNPVFVRNVLGR